MPALVIYTDGGARGNPGPSASAYWIPGIAVEWSRFLGNATNNEAEYEALIAALQYAVDHKENNVEIRSDSMLVVNQMKGKWRVNTPSIQPYWDRAYELSCQIPDFEIVHVRREQNKDADRIYNECMDAALGV